MSSAIGVAEGTTDSAPWLTFASRELARKVREVPGAGDSPDIQAYLATCAGGFDDDETPWCSAFVNWCMTQAGIRGTNRANARSWLSWGKALSEPRPGCVVVLWRDKPNLAKGHVGFFSEMNGSDLVLLGGNQGNAVSFRRYPQYRLLAYRWPSDASRLLRAATSS